METKLFYDSIRYSLFAGSISKKQFEGIEAILKEYARRSMNDTRKLAYILATAYHETARTMQPIEEYGKGKNYDYGKMLKMGGGPKKRIPYTLPKKLFYGRGHVQLTWYENYQAMGKFLGIDLLNNPELALTMDVSIKIMFEGMIRGMFTGRKLDDYFNDKVVTPEEIKKSFFNSRKIINGIDAAEKIASIAVVFYNALNLK